MIIDVLEACVHSIGACLSLTDFVDQTGFPSSQGVHACQDKELKVDYCSCAGRQASYDMYPNHIWIFDGTEEKFEISSLPG